MKTRNGFVSNSSSSSFCIYGAYIQKNDASEIVKKLKLEGSRDPCFRLGEYIESISDLKAHYGDCDWESYKVCLGLSWDKMSDSETMGAFKERVESEIRKSLGDGIESGFDLGLGIHEEGWYNG